MLPFLSKKNNGTASLTIKTRTPDEHSDKEPNENEGLEECMSELSEALTSGDKKAAARAFKAAFQICESEPHEEGEHTNDYDSQNELAAKDNE